MENDLLAIWHQSRHGASAVAVCAELDRMAAQRAKDTGEAVTAIRGRKGREALTGDRFSGTTYLSAPCSSRYRDGPMPDIKRPHLANLFPGQSFLT